MNDLDQGFPTWEEARGINSMISWVHLYKWGDAIDVRGNADTKRLGTPDLDLTYPDPT
jgi:hypothetical protein